MYSTLVPRLGARRPGLTTTAFQKLGIQLPSSIRKQSSSGQTQHAQPGSNNTFIVLSALGALGGLYYYYTRGQPAVDREDARRKEEEIKKRLRDVEEAGASKAESVVRQGQREYEQAKATVQDGVATARARATEARTDLTGRARQGAHDAQTKLDELKNTTEQKIGDTRDSSEKRFEEGKEEIARRAHDAENKTRGWFGLGRSK